MATRPGIIEALESSDSEWEIRITRLAESTALGCAFCAYILEKFFGPKSIWSSGYNASTGWYLKVDEGDETRKEVLNHAMHLSSLLLNDRVWFKVAPKMTTGTAGPLLEKISITAVRINAPKELHKKIFAIPGHPRIELPVFVSRGSTSVSPPARPTPNASPASAESLTQVAAWFCECVQEHGTSCCHSDPSAAFLPTRVIEILDDGGLRIKEAAQDEKGQYCTLSYQWGSTQDFQLTADTLDVLTDGFSIDQVPATIADAIKVTQSLGPRYLWVDALCILQDSQEDKGREIARMGDTYRQSALTIIAGNANNAKQGFLRSNAGPESNEWRSLIPLPYPVLPATSTDRPKADGNSETSATSKSYTSSDGSTAEGEPISWQTAWFMDDMEEMSYTTYRDPVAQRSWCLQERLLSPRILNYGHWPTWRCNRTVHTDGGFYTAGDPNVTRTDSFTRLLLSLSRGHTALPPEHFTLHKLLTAWYDVLTDYTQRHLGDANDRLPAISGIADVVSRTSGMTYTAGLWRSNMLHDLMWHSAYHEWLNRPETSRPPTWSWASINTPITYGHIDGTAVPVAVVTSYPETPANAASATFSGAVGSEVGIRGPTCAVSREDVLALLREQRLLEAVPKSATLLDFMRETAKLTGRDVGARNVSEEEVEATLPRGTVALVAYVHEEEDSGAGGTGDARGKSYSGLLLKPGSDGAWFERVGSFRKARATWRAVDGGEWKEETVRLR